MRALKIISGILATIVAMVAIPLLVVGAGMFSLTDGDGADLPTISATTSGRALTFGHVDLEFDGDSRWDDFEQVTVGVEGEDLFIGVARSDDVNRFLGTDLTPSQVDIWLRESSGADPAVEVDVDGLWTAVVMNSDGSRGVDAEVNVTLPATPVRIAGTAVLGAGAMAAIGSTLLFIVAFRRPTATPLPSVQREPEPV